MFVLPHAGQCFTLSRLSSLYPRNQVFTIAYLSSTSSEASGLHSPHRISAISSCHRLSLAWETYPSPLQSEHGADSSHPSHPRFSERLLHPPGSVVWLLQSLPSPQQRGHSTLFIFHLSTRNARDVLKNAPGLPVLTYSSPCRRRQIIQTPSQPSWSGPPHRTQVFSLISPSLLYHEFACFPPQNPAATTSF